jgi:hypothetical protein
VERQEAEAVDVGLLFQLAVVVVGPVIFII